ncbi:hypothetical protein [Timonella sp. A28]|uniref:hypothetical protein n=1 Tax=Timonella sp. A28 TaxID=3442640 RepID=UPI003EBB710C
MTTFNNNAPSFGAHDHAATEGHVNPLVDSQILSILTRQMNGELSAEEAAQALSGA